MDVLGQARRSSFSTQVRREVSLDSQGPGSVYSLGNSRLTLCSSTPLSFKSASFDLVDESIQVDLSADIIIYDSDDNMVKKKVTLLRNKKGHPIYSREDIREQYCITQKELEVLENAKGNRLFSCLARQSNMFCDSTSIFSCIARNRASSEEKLNKSLPSFRPSAWSNHHLENSSGLCNPKEEKSLSGAVNSDEDDEFHETSFRRRPKSVCLSDSKFRLALLVGEYERTNSQISSPHFESSGSLESSSHCSANSKPVNRGLDFTKTCQLQLGRKEKSSFTPCQSVDALSEELQKKQNEHGPQVEERTSKTLDLSVDERKQKHVSFDSSSLVRNNTNGEVEIVEKEAVSVTSAVNAQNVTSLHSEQNRSDERLLDTPLKFSFDVGDERFLSNQSSQVNSKNNILGRRKKAPMRAQATQTDSSVNISFTIPAYLTLSPRAAAPTGRWRHESHYKSASVLNKPHSSCDKLDKNDSEEELLEADLATKQHRFLRVFKQKFAQEERTVDAESEVEIMVSFKPYSPSEHNKGDKDTCSVQGVKQHHKTLCRNLSLESAKSDYLKKLYDLYGNSVDQSVHREFRDSLVNYFRKQSVDQETFRASGKKKNESDQELIGQKELGMKALPIVSAKENVDFISVTSETTVFPDNKQADYVQDSFKETTTRTDPKPLNQGARAKYTLEEGQESICVRADATFLQRENFLRTSDSASTCSLCKNNMPETDSTGCRTNSELSYSRDSIVSPDSDSSSSHFTEQETSRSDMSTSSSNFAIRSELSNRSGTDCEEISASSEYITANEHSNKERENRNAKLSIMSNNNSSSSPRCSKTVSPLFSSSRGFRRRKKPKPFCGVISEHVITYVTVTKNTTEKLSSNHSTDHLDSSEESTKKDFSSSDSELGEIPEIPIYEAAIIEDECGHTDDVTPVPEPSPEPSSMQDATTVIENRSDGTSGDLVGSLHDSLGCPLESMTDSDSQELEPNQVSEEESNIDIDNMTQKRAKFSEEVVSHTDLTEKPSQDDDRSSGQINQDDYIVPTRNDEVSDKLPSQNVEKVSTSPSLDSSTSESFVLDNGVHRKAEGDAHQFDEMKELDDNFEGFILDKYPSKLDQIKPIFSVSPTKSSESIDTDKDTSSEVTSRKTDSPAPAGNQISYSSCTTHCRENEGAIPKQTSVYHEMTRFRRRDREKPLRAVVTSGDSCTHHCLIVEKSQNSCSALNTPSYVEKAGSRGDFRSCMCNYCGDEISQQDHIAAPSVGSERHFRESFSIHDVQRIIRKARNRETSKYAVGEQYGRQGHRYICQPQWDNAISSVEVGVHEDEEEDSGLYLDSYCSNFWIYIGPTEELAVWNKLLQKNQNDLSPLLKSSDNPSLQRSESIESTLSEREFRRQYKAVTHRLVHRKSSMELYSRLAIRKLEVDKQVTIQRKDGEFGFRIHGSRPVVVSAIEPGSDTLCLELARTCHLLTPDERQPSQHALLSGFLQRLSIGGDTRRWCRRWFVLKTDNCLYWYKTPKISELAGVLVIHNHVIARVPGSGSSNTFRVSRHGLPHLYFAADDEETANRWISFLSDAASNVCHVDRYLERCLTNVHSPALTFQKPDCEGYLRRLGNRWKRRYFLLKDASLYLYLDRSSSAATAMFLLHGYKFQSCSITGKKNTFEATPSVATQKHFYFLADSEIDKKRWLAALEYSVGRWIKIG
ncbi:uncharacterized protein LOC143252591 isoform X2 [Tachypleus tridentatus]|uniref:uncharacterized protein LOC143252591 isoform X2 n=1 Tax=Tachypleus tridentatus TaxID=6853 RepID=UPI003FD359C2